MRVTRCLKMGYIPDGSVMTNDIRSEDIEELKQFPDFLSWLKETFISGYGIRKKGHGLSITRRNCDHK